MSDMDYFENEEYSQQEIKLLIEEYEKAIANNIQPHFDQERVEQIVEYYEQIGYYDKALKAINSALNQHPYSGLLLLKKAQILFDLKISEDALDCLDHAAIFEPSELGIYLLRSEIYVFQSLHDEALVILDKAMELAADEPEDVADVWLHMADVYEDLEKYNEVYNCLKECLLVDMQNEEALSRINYCMELTEEYEEAVELHKTIIDEYPYNFWAWYNLSFAYASLELYEKAIDALEFVVAIDEDITYAYKDMAQYYHEIGLYEKALETIKIYAGKTKSESDVYLLEGKCHFELGNLKAARFSFRKAIRTSPIAHEAYFNLGITYVLVEKWAQAYQNLQKAYEIYPESIDYLERLADVGLQLDDFDKVKRYCSKAIRLDSKYPKVYILLALAHLFCEESEKAVEVIDKGYLACDQDAAIGYVRAAIYIVSNRRKEGYLQLETLLESDFILHELMFKYFPFLIEDKELLALIEINKL
jgi:tetratricopeptide (TPR) repeat protein